MASEQWELFCDAKALGATNSNAIRAAGYNTRQPHQTGNALMKRPDILERIRVLTEHYRANPPPVVEDELPDPTVAWVTKKYVQAVQMSEECGDRSSMIKGLDSIAKLRGYMVDRIEQRTGPLDQLSADQLQAMITFVEQAQTAITVEAKIDAEDADE